MSKSKKKGKLLKVQHRMVISQCSWSIIFKETVLCSEEEGDMSVDSLSREIWW